MANPRPLRRAPITEALVDLRAVPTVAIEGERSLDQLKASLEGRYPRYSERRSFEAEVQFRRGQPALSKGTDKGFHGHFFESPDGREIAQFRVDGFTYNRLVPYTDWETVTTEALRLWDLYVEVARPLAVSRVAVRYINRLRIPPQTDLPTMLTRVPRAPEGAPANLEGYLTRVETLDPATGRRVITTQALTPAMPPEGRAVIIDIDAFKMGEFGVSSSAIRPILDGLRQLKNAVFFGSITEEAAKGFE
jgi:uncharacterized protein (TIGR04255 family)